MSEEIVKEQDPEFVKHLKDNVNKGIWINKDGTERNVNDMSHSERLEAYNLIITGELNNLLFVDEWKIIFNQRLKLFL